MQSATLGFHHHYYVYHVKVIVTSVEEEINGPQRKLQLNTFNLMVTSYKPDLYSTN